MPFLLLLASCAGRSIYEDAERTVTLSKITASSKPPGSPFSSLVTQHGGGEIVLSPLDTNSALILSRWILIRCLFCLPIAVRLLVGMGALALLKALRWNR